MSSDERRMMLLHLEHGDLVEWALLLEQNISLLKDQLTQCQEELKSESAWATEYFGKWEDARDDVKRLEMRISEQEDKIADLEDEILDWKREAGA